MKKKRKQVGRRRKFDRIALFPDKPIPDNIQARQSLQRAFPCRFCQKSYLDSMIEELGGLIAQKEMRVAIVDGSGNDTSEFYNIMAMLQGNGHGFK